MHKPSLFKLINMIVAIWCYCTEINAHEFWIEPQKFVVKSTEDISADLRVGQMMTGVSYGFYPRNFKQLSVKNGTKILPITGRLGDKPAIQIPYQGHRLVTLFITTVDNVVSYNDWSQFESFLREKNLSDAEEEHKKNNFPRSGFKEIYSRYAKALVGAGNSLGFDQKLGLETEIVLKQNPYIENTTNGLTVTLFYNDSPRGNTQIEVFSRSTNGIVKKEIFFTNDNGEAIIDVSSGTDYLVNAVVMRRPKTETGSSSSKDSSILWESLWASTTFRVP